MKCLGYTVTKLTATVKDKGNKYQLNEMETNKIKPTKLIKP